MTLQAQFWVHKQSEPPREQVVELADADDVRAFVTRLAGERVGDAVLTHTRRPRVETLIPDESDPGQFLTMPDHSVIVGVHGGRGAISYRGTDGHRAEPVHLYSRGDGPEHSVVYETDEFPPRCELPIESITQALIEFLETASRPLTITWQPGTDTHAHENAH